MTGWKGPQGRNVNIFFAAITLPFALIFLVGPRDRWVAELLWMGTYWTLMGVMYAILRWTGTKAYWDMVFKDTSLDFKQAGKAIEAALRSAGIAYEGPVTRPWSNSLVVPLQWEVEVPAERLRIGLLTGGLKGRVVLLGPVTLYHHVEADLLKGVVDGALGAVP